VAIYRDRIEIYNPGSFPEEFEPQDFIDRPERPIRRNPQIVDYLKENGQITSKIGTELTGKSLAQVKRYLKALEEMNVVKKSRNRKGNVYIMNNV